MIKSITWRKRTFLQLGGLASSCHLVFLSQHRQLSLLFSIAHTDRGIRTPTSEDLAI